MEPAGLGPSEPEVAWSSPAQPRHAVFSRTKIRVVHDVVAKFQNSLSLSLSFVSSLEWSVATDFSSWSIPDLS